MKTIYLDILVRGRFYTQLAYRFSPLFVIDAEDVKRFVLDKLPSLRNSKEWTIGFSNSRVFK